MYQISCEGFLHKCIEEGVEFLGWLLLIMSNWVYKFHDFRKMFLNLNWGANADKIFNIFYINVSYSGATRLF